ncbi:hypothetical protein CU052_13410 [Vibrio harveyi]|uniref:hypothetical protein n=1 Tax=Vibrio harveyi TaxID=669 RepID=UPI000C7CB2E3|nr:hypothetical protein [Vibrio harveyi]AWB00231.1 hypothetical protein CU052_13410 [Vibrio harveyi]
MSYSELHCGECGETIAYYKDSGAPHYHYYCESCKEKLEDEVSNPELHFNHGKPWMKSDQDYLIEQYGFASVMQISAALGRTYKTTCARIYQLKNQGLIEYKLASKARVAK